MHKFTRYLRAHLLHMQAAVAAKNKLINDK